MSSNWEDFVKAVDPEGNMSRQELGRLYNSQRAPLTAWLNQLEDPELSTRLQKALSKDSSVAQYHGKHADLFTHADPTTSKKYLRWILETYISGKNHLFEDVVLRMNTALRNFMSLTSRGLLEGKNADIWSYTGLFGERGLLDLIEEKDSVVLEDAKQELLYQDDELTVTIPQNRQASINLGRGTKWCTAYDDSKCTDHMFDTYTQNGNLYVANYKGVKYQLYVATNEPQFMDKNDEPVKFEEAQPFLERLFQAVYSTGEEPDFYGYNNYKRITTHLFAERSINEDDEDEPIISDLTQEQSKWLLEIWNKMLKHSPTQVYYMVNNFALLEQNGYKPPNTVQLLALQKDNITRIQYLLGHGVSPNVTSKRGNILFYNIEPGTIKFYIYQAGVDPMYRNAEGKYFMEVNPNWIDTGGIHPLIMKILTEYNFSDYILKQTLEKGLAYFRKDDLIAFLKLLQKRGISLREYSKLLFKSTIFTGFMSPYQFLSTLFEHGFDVNARVYVKDYKAQQVNSVQIAANGAFVPPTVQMVQVEGMYNYWQFLQDFVPTLATPQMLELLRRYGF